MTSHRKSRRDQRSRSQSPSLTQPYLAKLRTPNSPIHPPSRTSTREPATMDGQTPSPRENQPTQPIDIVQAAGPFERSGTVLSLLGVAS